MKLYYYSFDSKSQQISEEVLNCEIVEHYPEHEHFKIVMKGKDLTKSRVDQQLGKLQWTLSGYEMYILEPLRNYFVFELRNAFLKEMDSLAETQKSLDLKKAFLEEQKEIVRELLRTLEVDC